MATTPSNLDTTGLYVETAADQVTDLQNGMIGIYGNDINLASNSPDGQMIGLFVTAMQDLLSMLVNIYNMFSIDSAYGVMLQRLVAINGLTINPGNYTTTPVNVTANQALSLPGLDQTDVVPFSVADTNNTWTLLSSYDFTGAGTQALVFQCSVMGQTNPIANTITSISTPMRGITSVNNPTTAGTVLGNVEESDAGLRIRHGKMFQLAAKSPADAIEAQLLAIPGMQDAVVIENATSGAVGGVPAYSIWCAMVTGAGVTNVQIAKAIYGTKAPGCPMNGSVTQVLTRPNGQPTTMAWDVGVSQPLYVKFGITPVVAGTTFDNTLIKDQLVAALQNYYHMNQQATLGDVVVAMSKIQPGAILTGCQVSVDGSTWLDLVPPTTAIGFFTLIAGNITIS